MTEAHARKHGPAAPTIACRHIIRNIESTRYLDLGFHSERSPMEEKAWCDGCESRRIAAGGRWAPEALALAAFADICPCCFEFARMAALPDVIVETVRRR